MDDTRHYALHIDGPLFRAQRGLLLRIADQAHDRHGINCLL
jgi:hypothetical protein